MSKKITLTVGERTAAVGLLNAGKFNNSTLATVLDDIKKIVMTEDEWKAANLTKTPTDAEIAALSPEVRAETRQAWKWDETEATSKEIELEQSTIEALIEMVKDKSDKKELTLADGASVSLQKKLLAA